MQRKINFDLITPILLALGSIICQRRNKLSLSQEELALRCNVHRTYISDVERGKRNLSLAVLYDIAAGLKLEPIELLWAAQREANKRPLTAPQKPPQDNS